MLCLYDQELVDSLHTGGNIPTVLQSLGCLAQHSVSTFETQDEEITQFISKKIFQVIIYCLFVFVMCHSVVLVFLFLFSSILF